VPTGPPEALAIFQKGDVMPLPRPIRLRHALLLALAAASPAMAADTTITVEDLARRLLAL
jgi:hypothetical protein